MKQSQPTVSVCIPTFNGAKYIGEAIESTLGQTFENFELIVVDDCSTDNTEAVIASFRDSRLRFLRNPSRLGLAQNWNRCVELSEGEYVSLFHQDDVMLPQNIERKARLLKQNPSVGLVFSQALVVDGDGTPIRMFSGSSLQGAGMQDGLKFFEQFFLKPNIICCPSVMVRRSCYAKLGGFDERLSFACDFEMWMRICLAFDIAYIDETLLRYREHGENESIKFYDHDRNLREDFLARILVLDKFPKRIPGSKEVRRSIQLDYSERALSLAGHHYSHGRYEMARALLTFSAETHRPIMTDKRFIRLSAKLLLGQQPTAWIAQAKSHLQR